PPLDLGERGHDDGDRAEHGHSTAVRQCRRLVDDREPRGDGRAARDSRAGTGFALVSPALMAALPVRLGVLRALVKEISVSGASDKPLVVGGARELAVVLRRELGRGAKPGAVRADDEPKGGAVYVYVLGHDPTEADEAALKRARRARVPIVAVAAGPLSDGVPIPSVLAT